MQRFQLIGLLELGKFLDS
uniref:Uncharacterized protein n=1 Tax=Arundo donax TaxID=35708 RepID=A0A0A8ZR16_ARUDO